MDAEKERWFGKPFPLGAKKVTVFYILNKSVPFCASKGERLVAQGVTVSAMRNIVLHIHYVRA